MVRRGYFGNVGSDREDQPIDVGVRSGVLDNLVYNLAPDGFVRRHVNIFWFTKRHDREPIIEPTPKVFPKCLSLVFKARIDHVKAVLDPRLERRDVRGIMLKIIIHDHNHVASGNVQPSHDRVVLTDISAQVDPSDEVVFANQLDNYLPAFVGAVVVDEDQLVAVEMPADMLP